MNRARSRRTAVIELALMAALFVPASDAGQFPSSYPLDMLPSERRTETDPDTGATLTYLTGDPAADTNLYFHDRSWLADSSLILFQSARAHGGLMGCLMATGELVRFDTPKGGVGGATAALKRNSVYALRGREVLELQLEIESPPAVRGRPSTVMANERLIAELPDCDIMTALNESCDGTRLSLGVKRYGARPEPAILAIDIETGAITEVCRIVPPQEFHVHVQWSRSNPNLLSFAGAYPRINVVDVRSGTITAPYNQLRDELVTHEHWWVNDTIVFCGGFKPPPTEDSDVKILDVHTGVVRIIGRGSWWPGGTDEEIAKRNYWHCAGDEQGRWVVADNWHGDITVIEGKTSRPHVLTVGHRTYGNAEHPHVGWDRKGEQVVFTSHKRGNPDVCVATIPVAWQGANSGPVPSAGP
ncbi:MAG: hypothetical protein AMXMBFR4_18730 [Candidatus Hydrogenedentota bacterium]